jgi:HD-like signal output (HDOD) protein
MIAPSFDAPSRDGPLPLVVIVDDEPSILAALRSLLHRSPFRLQLFADCEPALQYITEQTPDIIISDMRMPIMDGTAFLTRVRAICPVSMRLLLSGYEDKGVIIDAIAHDVAQMYILKPWEDEEIISIIRSALLAHEDLRKRKLEGYIHGISSLPSSPLIQAQITQVFTKSDRSIKEVAAGVEKDPVLVAQLVRVANSVFFGARNPVANIQEAVMFIGLEYVEGLILGTHMFKALAGTMDKTTTRAIENLWRRAINRAIIGRTIAAQWPEYPHQHPAYITCLLMDIGFIVRLQMDPKEFLQLIALAHELHVPLHQAEERLFAVDHAIIGAALLRLWNFPPDIVAAIRAHHSEHTDDPLTRLIQMADIIEASDLGQHHDTRLNPTIVELQTHIFDAAQPSRT